jgi:hypothetical protein
MFDDEDVELYDSYDYDYEGYYSYPCMCSQCRAYRQGYSAGYYDALDSLEGLP